MSSKTRQQLEDWVSRFEISGKVLDVGGAQLSLKGRVRFAGESEIWTLDLPAAHEQNQKSDLVWDINKCLFSELSQTSQFERRDLFGTFDHVFCLEVSEYLWNPVCAMKNLALFLKEGGRAYVSFHFLYPVHKPVDADFLRYTPAGAEKLAEIAGFEVVKHTARVASTDVLAKFYASEGMKGAPLTNHLVIGSLLELKKK